MIKNILSLFVEEGIVLYSKKSSLLLQTNLLFLFSIAFIIALWVFFYFSQKHQSTEHDTARYFNAVTAIQPLMLRDVQIDNEMLSRLGLEKVSKPSLSFEISFEKGDRSRGFKELNFEDQTILHIYNSKTEAYFRDIHEDENMFLIHTVFIVLLFSQLLLYWRMNESLKPLSTLYNKLKAVQKGDLSSLDIQSNYKELSQLIASYNQAVSKLEYTIETREMFNKIFMHEMKMPLAKGMFYLKQEPSQKTHENLQRLLNNINDELEEFSQIESLLGMQNAIDQSQHSFEEIYELALNRAMANREQITLQIKKECFLKGDREFWVLCIKNLIDNALKYSTNGQLLIRCADGIYFENLGEALPVDISKDIKAWRIQKNKRHQSSTGYGFGLFIIKNIITIHNYRLSYTYNEKSKKIILGIVQ